MPKLSLEIDMSGWEELEKQMTYLESKQIEYGYPVDKMHPEAKVPVAAIAKWNNTGVKDKSGGWKIPPRPFMEISAIYTDFEMNKYNQQIMLSLLKGKTSVERALDYVGKEMADNVRQAIGEGNYAALAPSTIRQKGSDTILMDSSFMYDNASHEVTNNTGERD